MPLDAERPLLPHIPALDGLRAVAVASVFAYHADVAWIPGGFLGVDVFFVISGFLITALLLAEWRRDRFIDVWAFWKRRARRLLPALAVLLVGVWAVVPVLAAEQAGRLRGDVWAALAYISNWRLIFEHQSYFEAIGRPPLLQHLWSLAVEEQFYVLWPLVLWAGLGARRKARRLAGWILAGTLASAALMAVLHTPGTDPSRVYYGTDTRVGTILLGAALACVWAPWRSKRTPTRMGRTVLLVAGSAGLGALVWCMASLHQFDDVLYGGGLLAVAAASAVVVGVVSHPGTPVLRAVLGARPLVWLGRRSYGIYLFHWPVIMLTRASYDVPLSGGSLLALRAGITLALAAVSYRFVEAPVRAGALGRLWADLRGRAPERHARTGWVAVRALALTAAVAAVATTAVVARSSTTPPALADVEAASTVVPPETSTTAAPVPTGPEATTSTLPTSTAVGTTVAPVPTTEAPPVVPTTVPGTHVTGLGDSVLLEAKAMLERRLPDVAVDAVVGRQFKDLLALARSLRDSGRLGPTVLLQLGNNGPVTGSQFDEIMEVLRGAPRVVVINVKVPRPWEVTNNEMFAARAPRWPNAVLLDWHKHGSAHPELFADDGTHMGPTGVVVFVELILAHL